MIDPRIFDLYASRNWTGLFQCLDGMWIVVTLECLDALVARGFKPHPDTHLPQLNAARVNVGRMQVALAAALHKNVRSFPNSSGITWDKFRELYARQLASLPEQQNREIAEYFNKGVVSATAEADIGKLRWGAIPITFAAQIGANEFIDAFREGAYGNIPDDLLTQLETKVRAEPGNFFQGYVEGYLSGLLTGLKNLFEALVSLVKLAPALSFPVIIYKTSREAFLLLTDSTHLELRKRQTTEAARIVQLIKQTAEDINVHPGDYVALGKDVGRTLGEFAGLYITAETVGKPAQELGEAIGSVVGQVAFEIVLQIVLDLGTAGAGNAARAVAMLGNGTRGSARLAALSRRLAMLLERTEGLRRFLIALHRDERGAILIAGKLKPIPKGLISKGHVPPGMKQMVDPFGTIAGGITGQAGTARSVRTAIDASAAEFEVFNRAVFERGEIGIQSAGGANAPGVDFVTARRGPNGLMEVLLNDATINLRKKPKTIPPSRWVEEAKEAAKKGRLDIGDAELEEEIRQALEQGRSRVRTLTATHDQAGNMIVNGW